MAKTWFISNTHFGHANIIKHCARPFATAEDMDAALIANWNALVRADDDIWHLGDFSYRSARPLADYLRRLNGRSILSGTTMTTNSAGPRRAGRHPRLTPRRPSME